MKGLQSSVDTAFIFEPSEEKRMRGHWGWLITMNWAIAAVKKLCHVACGGAAITTYASSHNLAIRPADKDIVGRVTKFGPVWDGADLDASEKLTLRTRCVYTDEKFQLGLCLLRLHNCEQPAAPKWYHISRSF